MRASVVRHGRVDPVPCSGHVPVHPVQAGLVTPVQCSRLQSTLPCRSRPPSYWSPPRCGGLCWSPPQSAVPRCPPAMYNVQESGRQCSTWQPSFPFSPPAHSMACLISLPNTVLHWVSLTTGTDTCSRTVQGCSHLRRTRSPPAACCCRCRRSWSLPSPPSRPSPPRGPPPPWAGRPACRWSGQPAPTTAAARCRSPWCAGGTVTSS